MGWKMLALTAAFFIGFTAPASASDALDVRLPDGSTSLRTDALGGDTVWTVVNVANRGPDPLPVRLMVTGADRAQALRTWATVTPERVVVPAFDGTEVVVRIELPADVPSGALRGAVRIEAADALVVAELPVAVRVGEQAPVLFADPSGSARLSGALAAVIVLEILALPARRRRKLRFADALRGRHRGAAARVRAERAAA